MFFFITLLNRDYRYRVQNKNEILMKVCTAVNADNVLLKVQIRPVHLSYEVM